MEGERIPGTSASIVLSRCAFFWSPPPPPSVTCFHTWTLPNLKYVVQARMSGSPGSGLWREGREKKKKDRAPWMCGSRVELRVLFYRSGVLLYECTQNLRMGADLSTKGGNEGSAEPRRRYSNGCCAKFESNSKSGTLSAATYAALVWADAVPDNVAAATTLRAVALCRRCS